MVTFAVDGNLERGGTARGTRWARSNTARRLLRRVRTSRGPARACREQQAHWATGEERMMDWWRRWRLRRQAAAESERLIALREFVYLDEVAVTSLLSSRFGKVPSEFTDTLTRSFKSQSSSGLNTDQRLLKAQLGSSLESS